MIQNPKRRFTPIPRTRHPSRHAAALAVVALSIGCTPAPEAAPPRVASPSAAPPLDSLYDRSIREAAVVAPGDEKPLRPLTAGPDGTFTVFTWAECRGTVEPGRCGSYIADRPVQATWDIWVSAGTEVRDKCKVAANQPLRIWQTLGMPPAEGGTSRMVTLTGVQPSSIFRPCPDPRTETTSCNGTAFVSPLPPNAPPNFFEWFAKQAVSSWQIAAAGRKPAGYPWTRLGYTYDWAPDAKDRYGASEYVIPGQSKPLSVMVQRVQTAEEFCR